MVSWFFKEHIKLNWIIVISFVAGLKPNIIKCLEAHRDEELSEIEKRKKLQDDKNNEKSSEAAATSSGENVSTSNDKNVSTSNDKNVTQSSMEVRFILYNSLSFDYSGCLLVISRIMLRIILVLKHLHLHTKLITGSLLHDW